MYLYVFMYMYMYIHMYLRDIECQKRTGKKTWKSLEQR